MKRNLILLVLTFLTLGVAMGNNFRIEGTRIIDPQGNDFIPQGANVQGVKYGWPGDVAPQADKIINAWKFNILRVNCRLYDQFWNGQNVSDGAHYQTIESMQALVDAFTPHGVVVMFEFHDRTGSYYTGNDLEDLKDAFREMAILWKDNPYVWFNIMNEPGGSSPDLNQWVSMHRQVISVIRDEMKADNVIVVDAHYWGQDVGTWDTNPVPEANSSILSRGHELLSFNDKTYENIVFSLHIYDQWNRGTQEEMEYKLHNYISRVHQKGYALMIGEFGTSQETTQSLHFPLAFRATMNVAPAHGVGLIWWHWYGGDALKLTTSGNGGGNNINSNTNPTNLSWPGKMIWDYTHRSGNQPPFVTIYNPVSTQIYNEGANLNVKLAAEDFDNGIQEVRLYSMGNLLKTFTEQPYEYLIPNAVAGRYPFYAVAVDSAGVETTSATIAINVTQSPHQGNLLFITGGTTLTISDNTLYDELLRMGFRVFHKPQADVRDIDATNRRAVIISSSVSRSAIGTMFRNSTVPVLVARSEFFTPMMLTGSMAGVDYGQISAAKEVSIASDAHPVTEGLSGTLEVYHSAAKMAFAKPAPGGEVLLTATDDSNKATVVAYPSGSQLMDMSAPASRAIWFASAEQNVLWTDQARDLFNRLMSWLVSNATSTDDLTRVGMGTQLLMQNYPNPVGKSTTIEYTTTQAGNIKLLVIDNRGAVMEVLEETFRSPGSYKVVFTPSSRYSQGIYYYQLQINDQVSTRPMLIR